MIHRFDLAIEVHEDGSATASLSDPGSHDTPITEAGGSTPDLALAALAEKVTIPVRPKGTIWVNGQECKPGIPAGCSSPNGHYVGLHAVQTALDLGWQDTMASAAAETYDEWHGREHWAHVDLWPEIVDDAEQWLNNHTEGGMWLWNEGDFLLIRIEDCPLCGGLLCPDDEAPGPCPDHLFGWL